MFARRTDWKLTRNRLTVALEGRRSRGLPVIDLTETNPTRCRLPNEAESILGALTMPGSLRYEPSPKGLEEAREAVAGYYGEKGIKVDPEQVVLTASTSEAYAFLFRLLADPGDRVMAPRPGYPLFDLLSDLNDVELDHYPVVYDGIWRVALDSLVDGVTPRTRAILVVHPNNPTGSYLSGQERLSISELCADRAIALVSDEVFLDFNFLDDPGGTVVSLAGSETTLTFVLGGISKLLGLPQMKLGWICVSGPESLRNEALNRLEVIADTYLSVNTPVQRALPRWLASRAGLTGAIRSRVIANRSWLLDRVRICPGVHCLEAEGGWSVILRVAGLADEEAFILELLDREGVLVHPGYFFDIELEGHLVVSLLPEPSVFNAGMDRVLKCLDR